MAFKVYRCIIWRRGIKEGVKNELLVSLKQGVLSMDFNKIENNLIELLSKNDNNIIAVEGATGTGKTILVNKLQKSFKDQITVLTSEKFIKTIIDALKLKTNPIKTFESINDDIIVIEDIDYGLAGKRVTRQLIAQMLSKLLKYHKIVITGIELENRIPDIIKNNEKHLIFLRLE